VKKKNVEKKRHDLFDLDLPSLSLLDPPPFSLSFPRQKQKTTLSFYKHKRMAGIMGKLLIY